VQLTFINVCDDKPIECTFEFPLEDSTVVTKLVISIDDRTIEAQIKAREEAKEKYDDALASGNTAVFAERDDKLSKITLLLGNLPPNQTAVVNLQMIKPLRISGGAFEFALPVSFLPQYKQHERTDKVIDLVPQYTFEYNLTVGSSQNITYISAPTDSTTT
jgi:Ca-activated chloride channel homolog